MRALHRISQVIAERWQRILLSEEEDSVVHFSEQRDIVLKGISVQLSVSQGHCCPCLSVSVICEKMILFAVDALSSLCLSTLRSAISYLHFVL
jgi:hypothetical protein